MRFVDELRMKTGTRDYINSGVIERKELVFPGARVRMGPIGFREFAAFGDKGYDALLKLDPFYDNKPHLHPGGELGVVLRGMYFDADMEGNPIFEYPEGTIVWYNKFSTHRPLTGKEGAHIYYVTFSGFVEKPVPYELVIKAKQLKAPEGAIDYMLHWMIKDPEERQRIMTKLFPMRENRETYRR